VKVFLLNIFVKSGCKICRHLLSSSVFFFWKQNVFFKQVTIGLSRWIYQSRPSLCRAFLTMYRKLLAKRLAVSLTVLALLKTVCCWKWMKKTLIKLYKLIWRLVALLNTYFHLLFSVWFRIFSWKLEDKNISMLPFSDAVICLNTDYLFLRRQLCFTILWSNLHHFDEISFISGLFVVFVKVHTIHCWLLFLEKKSE